MGILRKTSSTDSVLFVLISTVWLLLSDPAFETFRYLPLALALFHATKMNVMSSAGVSLIRFYKENKLLFLLAALTIVSVFRNNSPLFNAKTLLLKSSSLAIFFFYTFTFFKFYSIDITKKVRNVTVLILLPYLFASSVNILAYLVGLKKESKIGSGDGKIGELLGLSIERVNFIFVNGVNSYAVLSGVILLIALVLFFFDESKRNKTIYATAIGVQLVIAVLTDSRSALMYVLISAMVIWLTLKTGKLTILKLLPIAIVAGPILLNAFLPLLSNSASFNSYSRNDEDFATGNSRFLIWAASIFEFVNFKWEHLFGFGEHGILKSGVFANVSLIFADLEEIYIHPHNAVLVILFDSGYVGLFAFSAVIIQSMKRVVEYWNKFRILNVIVAAFNIYLILGSITESLFGFYYQNFNCILFSIYIAQAVAVVYTSSSKKVVKRRTPEPAIVLS